ncbi:hypothetical protein FACS1894187_14360 [Synergistales bacterium]|nr:hypothetical protein FACS1894187_14360 [Synergistales bacterium]
MNGINKANDSIQNIAAVAEEQAETIQTHAKTLTEVLFYRKLKTDKDTPAKPLKSLAKPVRWA